MAPGLPVSRTLRENGPVASPFLKWAGGKGRLAARIAEMVPGEVGRYHEPFVGGGAVFFAVATRLGTVTATLNDLNKDLVSTYEVVKRAPDDLIARLRSLADGYLPLAHAGRTAEYYRVRATRPHNEIDRAARLIFLNRTCYNGLYRVNRTGDFNVPHGRYAAPRIADSDGLLLASRALGQGDMTCGDFETAMALAQPGDFVYLDPPYQPLSRTSRFTGYTSGEFGWAEQVRLRDAVERLTQQGVAIALSNAWQPDILDLYAGFGYSMIDVPMGRAINSMGAGRAPIPELLLTNFPRPEVKHGLPASAK
jgi:DNA adenine methylase